MSPFARFALVFLLVAVPAAVAAQTSRPIGSIDRNDLGILAAGVTLALLAHAEEDDRMTLAGLDRPLLDGPNDWGDAYGHGLTLGAGAGAVYATGRLTGSPHLTAAAREMAGAFLLSSALTWSLKIAVNRTRPDGGPHSFPSGHTAVAFSVAPVLAERFGPWVGVPAYAMATATALGRMEEKRHFLSDVLAGAAIGIVSGRVITGLGGGRNAQAYLVVRGGRPGLAFEF